MTAIGFMIVALFVLTWVASAAIWRFGRIEERWSAKARPWRRYGARDSVAAGRARLPPMTAPEAPTPDASRLRGTLLAAALAIFVVQLDFFSINLALPRMSEDLGVSVTDLQWAISGFMLAVAAFLIPGGRLGDILGRRRMLVVGLAIFIFSSTVCGIVSSAELVIGFRVLQGIGGAIVFPVAVAVVSQAFPEEVRARAIGNLLGIAAISTAIGPFVGGLFTEAISWRAVFLLNLPVGLLGIALVLRYVAESRDESVPHRIDLPGLTAVAAGIALVTFAVDRGEQWGWLAPETIGVFLAGLALLALFVAIEKRVRWPLVDLALFRNRPYVIITALGTIANVAFTSTMLATTIYLQQVLGYSPLAAGAIFLSFSAMISVSGPLAGRLAERFNVARVIPAVLAIGSAGLVVVALDPGLVAYLAGLAVAGIGYGIGWSIVNVGTQQVVPSAVAGEASGVTLAVVVGFGGLGVAITAAMIEALSTGAAEASAIESILLALALGSAALGALLGLLDRRLGGTGRAAGSAGDR